MNTNLNYSSFNNSPHKKKEKVILIILVIICVVAIIAFFVDFSPIDSTANLNGEPQKKENANQIEFNTISAADLKSKIESSDKFILLDVRTPEEFIKGHIKNATSMPLAELDDKTHLLPNDIDIITSCDGSNCHRSKTAATQLNELGFSHLMVFEGGTTEWENQGYPLISGPISYVENLKIFTISPADLKDLLDIGTDVILIDLRSAMEFSDGHIENAINIAFNEISTKISDQTLPLDKKTILYEFTGSAKAGAAAKTLYSLGAKDVSILEGGIEAWQNKNYKIKK